MIEGVRLETDPAVIANNWRLLRNAVLTTGIIGGQKVLGDVNGNVYVTLGATTLALGTGAVDRLTVDANGLINVPGMHNVTGATGAAQSITGGSYTPTIVNVANVAASANPNAYWLRVGSLVVVFGSVEIDSSAGTTLTQFGISLPIASNLANAWDLAGVETALLGSGLAVLTGTVSADTANDRAQGNFISEAAAANVRHRYVFGYIVQ